jgi:hypothetical protein
MILTGTVGAVSEQGPPALLTAIETKLLIVPPLRTATGT